MYLVIHAHLLFSFVFQRLNQQCPTDSWDSLICIPLDGFIVTAVNVCTRFSSLLCCFGKINRVPQMCTNNFTSVFVKPNLRIDILNSCEIGLMWVQPNLTDDESILVRALAWFWLETGHYLSQCWPRWCICAVIYHLSSSSCHWYLNNFILILKKLCEECGETARNSLLSNGSIESN